MKRPHLLRRLSTLRPRSGRKLPKQYRVRNVDLLAFKATKGVRDPAFAELLSEIDDGAPLHTGHQVELFFRGDQAFDAMCDAIAGARREILLESYTLKSDRTGRRIYGGLREASLRGVTVRVIADAVGSFETDEEFWEQIRDSDVDFQLYHPLLGKIWKTLYRDHRKILVVDREVAFTGGMNIADEYGYGDEDGDAWRDTHVRARGSVAQEMAGVFLEGWLRAGGEPFEGAAASMIDPGSEGDPPGDPVEPVVVGDVDDFGDFGDRFHEDPLDSLLEGDRGHSTSLAAPAETHVRHCSVDRHQLGLATVSCDGGVDLFRQDLLDLIGERSGQFSGRWGPEHR